MSKYIVTTSIYPPSDAIIKFSNKPEWKLIVVGDKKTPHELYRAINNIIYLDPDFQETNYKTLSDLIGWNCTSRRSIGYVEAIKRGAEIVASVDDDNIPYDDWGTNLILNTPITIDSYKPIDECINVFDPLSPTNHSSLWHRGYPLNYVHNKNNINKEITSIIPDVQADFWDGDPDIDAIERMIYAPTCKFDKNVFPFTSSVMSPFNSQNTFLTKKAIIDYFMFPDTGRMEDIWASYYCLSKQHKVVYNKPTVFQERNAHNYIVDFKNEIIGYENNSKLINELLQNPENIKNFISEKSYKAFKEYQNVISIFM